MNFRLTLLMRQGFLVPGARTSRRIRWTYTGSDIESASAFLTADLTAPTAGLLKVEMDNFQQWIDLRTQSRHFGGRQWYFECPETGRLVTSLWLPNGARRFASRHAWPRQVAYGSQFKTPYDRAISGAFRIRQRLDKTGIYHSIGDFVPPKPKRMHWRTFEKLLEKLESYETITEAHTAFLMNRLFKLV